MCHQTWHIHRDVHAFERVVPCNDRVSDASAMELRITQLGRVPPVWMHRCSGVQGAALPFDTSFFCGACEPSS